MSAEANDEVLETVVKPWIEGVSQWRPDVFQKDSAPTQTPHVTQQWLSDNFHDQVVPNMWPFNSPDLNSLNYYVSGVINQETNLYPHARKVSLKAAISKEMTYMYTTHVIWACDRFQGHVEATIQADEDFIESVSSSLT